MKNTLASLLIRKWTQHINVALLQEIPYHLVSMDFGVEMDGSQDFFQMFWPVVVSHKIDEKSPLYSMSARDIGEHTFEIILTMEGITPETGNTVQVGENSEKLLLTWLYLLRNLLEHQLRVYLLRETRSGKV